MCIHKRIQKLREVLQKGNNGYQVHKKKFFDFRCGQGSLYHFDKVT